MGGTSFEIGNALRNRDCGLYAETDSSQNFNKHTKWPKNKIQDGCDGRETGKKDNEINIAVPSPEAVPHATEDMAMRGRRKQNVIKIRVIDWRDVRRERVAPNGRVPSGRTGYGTVTDHQFEQDKLRNDHQDTLE